MKNQNKNIWPDCSGREWPICFILFIFMPLTVAFGLLPALFSVYCVYRSQTLDIVIIGILLSLARAFRQKAEKPIEA